LLLLVPVALLLFMGWQRRWTADDGFIDLRVVRQLREGHGPVFNVGDRVEVATSPMWVAVLSVLDLLLPLRLEWIAALTSLLATAGALVLAVFGTRRALLACRASVGWLIPLGALVYAVLPPAWDFATSGLETGISLLWIATCWWLLCRRVGPRTPPTTPWFIPVVLGLGPLLRPDFLIFSVFFLAALLVRSARSWRTVAGVLGLAAALPVVVEVFRMGYYGTLVPNTAIAKEGTLANWHQGWLYLRDFVRPYWLVVPLALLLVFELCRRQGEDQTAQRQFRTLVVLTLAAGVVYALFVVRVGGDFMHGRMLLPALFTLLLPVSVVVTAGARWALVAVVAIWAVACAFALRTPYSGSSTAARGIFAAVDPKTGIADERLFWTRGASSPHPVTIDDYLANPIGQAARRTRELARSGHRGLLLDGLAVQQHLLPLRRGVSASIVAGATALGIYSYAAGDAVTVVDDHGLADPLAAHQRLVRRGRPGHEKSLPAAWMLARWASPAAPIPHNVSAADIDAARRALRCGPLEDLLAVSSGPLDATRIVDNVLGARRITGLRFPANPQAAVTELCDRGGSH